VFGVAIATFGNKPREPPVTMASLFSKALVAMMTPLFFFFDIHTALSEIGLSRF
jgi:hypothetical protein